MAKETAPAQPSVESTGRPIAVPRRPAQNSHIFNVPKAGRPRPEHHGARATSQSQNSATTWGMQLNPGAANPNDLFSSLSSGTRNGNTISNTVPTGSSSSASQIPPQLGTASMPPVFRSSSAADDDLFTPVDAWSSRGSQAPAPNFSSGFAAANRQPWKNPSPKAIQKPANAPVPNRQAAPQPFFSSRPAAAFDPYHMPPTQQFVDLTRPQFKSRPIEIVDVEDYMDQDEANEKLKNLLEGNLGGDDVDDDEEDEAQSSKMRELAETMNSKLGLGEEADKKAASPTPKTKSKSTASVDDGSRPGLKVNLLSHQIAGVKWMNQKESGKGKKKGNHPRGGILADDMGLGKTLQTIATIVTNPRPAPDSEEAKKQKINSSTTAGTLIVVPLPLLQQWEGEIAKFVDQSLNYKVHVHYGPKRQTRGKSIAKNDIVLTTYETLVSDFGNSEFVEGGQRAACFEIDWYRVVLDEAHRIKNPATKQSKACCALNSHYRWCLTGTPMQNRLDEIQSLIRFLNIEPYNNMRHWKDQITNPMNKGKGGIAMRRVQILLKAILLRRTKDLLREKGELHTVGRKVEDVAVQFGPAEKNIYDNLEDRMANTIDRMGSKLNYANALVLLLRLRQACNHPELVKGELGQDKDALIAGNNGASPFSPSKTATPKKNVDQLADVFGSLNVVDLEMDERNCQVCGAQLETGNRSSNCESCEADFKALDQAGHSSKTAVRSAGRKLKQKSAAPNRSKDLRRRIFDSDDEEDEESEGEWLVPDDQRGPTDLGQAGGTDDEDAEGGGDSLGEEDSETDDDDDEDDESIIGRRSRPAKKSSRKHKPPGLESDSDDDSIDDSDDDLENSDDEGSDSIIAGVRSRPRKHSKAHAEPKTPDLFISAKIRELMNILQKESKAHKTIVFSSFVSMLKLIEPFLDNAGYRYVHYNGQMRNDMREASLNALRNDSRTRVLLCSLKSGALGLNLTAASRVVIIEPFWNPFVEEQAIDRVHRIGQKHDVVVYKLTVADSVEQRIVALQEKKRELAKMALESGQKVSGAGALTMQQVLALFRRDAEHGSHEEGEAGEEFRESRGSLLRRKDSEANQAMPSSRPRHGTKPGYPQARPNQRPEDPVYGRR